MSDAEEVQRLYGVKPSDGVPHFVTSAWPRSVPTELLALNDHARISYEEKIGGLSGNGICSAGDYRAAVQATIARQSEGYVTLNEAAQRLTDAGLALSPVETKRRFLLAHSNGKLPIHQGGSRFPLEVGETIRDFLDLLEVGELDAWLRASAGYGFPAAAGTGLEDTRAAAVAQAPAPDRGRRMKRAALIADNVRRWPTVERDLKDAAANGLSEAAKDNGAGWWWEGCALDWARARAKIQDGAARGLEGLPCTIHRMKG